MKNIPTQLLVWLLAVLLVWPWPLRLNAQSNGTTFKPEEIEQLVAPIALYPDSLVSQILMASTYPLEVVQADRWAKANKTLDKMEDPRETLDYSYQTQLELLQKVRRGVADVATSRKRLELQMNQLQQSSARLDRHVAVPAMLVAHDEDGAGLEELAADCNRLVLEAARIAANINDEAADVMSPGVLDGFAKLLSRFLAEIVNGDMGDRFVGR